MSVDFIKEKLSDDKDLLENDLDFMDSENSLYSYLKGQYDYIAEVERFLSD